MPREGPRSLPWGILIWPAISPRSRIICARSPTPLSRNLARSKRFSGRFRYADICPSRFRMWPSAATAWRVRRKSPTEGFRMRRTKLQVVSTFTLGFATLAVLLLPACSVNVKKEKNGEDKQVDIDTPVGGIHVSKGANVADVGLAVYPGARLKQENSDGKDKSANVNISGFGFGLKVVALEY